MKIVLHSYCAPPNCTFSGDMQIINGGFNDFVDFKKWSSSTSIRNMSLELDVKPTYYKTFDYFLRIFQK